MWKEPPPDTRNRGTPESGLSRAEGFGAYARGGRGGKVLLVTTLADSGPGSLREACEAEGPRIVLFRVSGIVALESDLIIANPYITIAGQTAPGDGICLKNRTFRVAKTHDVIVRHMRFRPGDVSRTEIDALTCSQSSHVIFDHCSASWSIDEVWSTNKDCKNLTTQWCLIAEALNDSFHKKGPHGYGSLVSSLDGGISMHNNVYAHNSSRNPRAGGEIGVPGVLLDFRNNLIYNWGIRAGYTGSDPCRINYIANYLKPGPSTEVDLRDIAFHLGGPDGKIYLADNWMENAPAKNSDNWLLVTKDIGYGDGPLEAARADTPFPAPAVSTVPAQEVYERILAGVGATRPRRDAVDTRIVDEIRRGGGRHIDSQTDVGGWPEYRNAEPPIDSDIDGMPDLWEKRFGLNPESPADAQLDLDDDGYTNVEEYINGTKANAAN